MNRFFAVFVFLFSITCLHAKSGVQGSVIKIWNDSEKIELKNINSELILYKPDSAIANGAAIIICPGGSYGHLGLKHEGYDVAQWLNKLGFTAFVLKYRVSMQGYHYPAMIEDLQRSIQVVRENCKVWSLNPNKLGVMGFSAGGHLVGTSAIYYNEDFIKHVGIESNVSLRPDFVVMLYPVVSMHDSIAHKKSRRNLLGRNYSKDLENKLSLEDNVHEGMPPIFIVQAKGDEVVDYRNSFYFYQQLHNKHIVNIQYILYNCAGHGYGIDPKRNKEASQWIFECEKWFHTIGIETKQYSYSLEQ